MKRALIAAIAALVLGGGFIYAVGMGWFGNHEGPGVIEGVAIPDSVISDRTVAQNTAAAKLGVGDPKQILFGDLHVHTTVSPDAFLFSLPSSGGEGTHPQADACDFARYCSALDFWSINDHAEATTPRRWAETIESIRQCNAVAGNADDPDMVSFLGWEWSQAGSTPENHYGHKNVVIRSIKDGEIPTRAIASRPPLVMGEFKTVVPFLGRVMLGLSVDRGMDMARFHAENAVVPYCREDVNTTELPVDCVERAMTPGELFRKLDEWGHDSIVIPHGTAWGLYTPPGATWDHQLTAEQNDPDRQTLIEISSGHGNSEEYRSWRAIEYDDDGNAFCPAPVEGFMAGCWRAGEIIRERCLAVAEDADECESRAAEARSYYLDGGIQGSIVVPGATQEDWLDSGQCTDCFLPSYSLRPGGSAQYITAISNFDEEGAPKRFRMGFIGSSDIHSARPGTGYKEFDRIGMSDSLTSPFSLPGMPSVEDADPLPYSIPYKQLGGIPFDMTDRVNYYVTTGGLVAVHADGRDRDSIWSGLDAKETYGTSGGKTLLWFDLVNSPDGARAPMGSVLEMNQTPQFEVRAVGAYKQNPGCPEYALSALSPERLALLCHNECDNPSDERKLITRIEVIRIRPQMSEGESVDGLIEDPWRTFNCEADPDGCVVTFRDPEFASAERDTAYYVRAIEEPSPAVNGNAVACEYDETGQCVEVTLCKGEPGREKEEDCLAPVEERAWSSPIYVDYGQ